MQGCLQSFGVFATIALLCWSNVLIAQLNQSATGARATSTGGASTLIEDGWALYNNPSNLASLSSTTVSFAFDNRFHNPAFNTYSFAYTQPTKSGTVGIGLGRFGDELFNQQFISLAYGHSIEGVNLGLAFHYVQYGVAGLGTRGMPSIDFGVSTQLEENLYLGAHISNLNQAKIAYFEDERLPSVLSMGLRFEAGEKLVLYADGKKDLERSPSFHAGLTYLLVARIEGRAGISTNPSTAYFGVGFLLKKFEFNYALYTHQRLGLSHTVGIQIFPEHFLKRKKEKSP